MITAFYSTENFLRLDVASCLLVVLTNFLVHSFTQCYVFPYPQALVSTPCTFSSLDLLAKRILLCAFYQKCMHSLWCALVSSPWIWNIAIYFTIVLMLAPGMFLLCFFHLIIFSSLRFLRGVFFPWICWPHILNKLFSFG